MTIVALDPYALRRRSSLVGLGDAQTDAQVNAAIASQAGEVYKDVKAHASASTITKDVIRTNVTKALSGGGAAGAGSACVATGVGAAAAPICAWAGGKFEQFLTAKLGPIIDDVVDDVMDTFDPNKKKVAAQKKHIAEQAAGESAYWIAVNAQNAAMDVLREAVQSLRDQHEALDLSGDYGWVAATSDLSQVGLQLAPYQGKFVSGTKDVYGVPLVNGYLTLPSAISQLAFLSGTQLAAQAAAMVGWYSDWLTQVQAAVSAATAKLLAHRAAIEAAGEVFRQQQIAKEQAHRPITIRELPRPTQASAAGHPWLWLLAGGAVAGYVIFRRKRHG